jgi:hypothetical protein
MSFSLLEMDRNGIKIALCWEPPSQAWFADLKLRENLRAAVREAVEGLGRRGTTQVFVAKCGAGDGFML